MKPMTGEEKYIYMTQSPIPALIGRLSVPTIASMLITTFYNMADTFFVGKLDTASVGAVGISFSVMAVIQAVGFMFGNGSGACLARELGAKEPEKARITASTGFFSALIFGLLIAAAGEILLRPIARLLGSTETILPYAVRYMGIILASGPIHICSLVINNQLKLQGNTAYAMVGIVSGGVLNLLLDPLFIFAFRLGVTGAALATAAGQLFSFIVLLTALRRSGGVRIGIRSFRPSPGLLLRIVANGFPSLCRQGIASIATILLNRAAGVYGDAAIAGMTITNRITMFANSALIGFGQGFQPVCAFNYGAKKYRRVLESFWFCVKLGLCFLIVAAVLISIFAPDLARLFRADDEKVVEVAAAALRWQIFMYPLNAWMVMLSMMLQVTGKSFRASVTALCRQGIFFIPSILTVPRLLGLRGVEMAQFCSDIPSFCTSLVIGILFLRELRRDMRETELAAP